MSNEAPPPKWVLLYESAEDIDERAPAFLPAHVARLQLFHERGELLLVGTFADAQADGSMSIFRSKRGAEEFVTEDPFLRNGVVRGYRLLQWNEIYGT